MNAAVRRGLIATLIVSAGALGVSQSLLAGPDTAFPTEVIVASKRTRVLVIAITSKNGRLKGGENSFCVAFQKRETNDLVDVHNVSADFTLLVGRIEEEPIRSHLDQEQHGRYCSQVNLGKQYYTPASYYAFVRYTDAAGKKRKERLFLSVR